MKLSALRVEELVSLTRARAALSARLASVGGGMAAGAAFAHPRAADVGSVRYF